MIGSSAAGFLAADVAVDPRASPLDTAAWPSDAACVVALLHAAAMPIVSRHRDPVSHSMDSAGYIRRRHFSCRCASLATSSPEHRLDDGQAGDLGQQRRRGAAPHCRVFKVGAVQVPPTSAFEVQALPLIFIQAILLVGERDRQRLANERVLGFEVGTLHSLRQTGGTKDLVAPLRRSVGGSCSANQGARTGIAASNSSGSYRHCPYVLPCCPMGQWAKDDPRQFASCIKWCITQEGHCDRLPFLSLTRSSCAWHSLSRNWRTRGHRRMEAPTTPEQWMSRAADARMTALGLGAGASRQMLFRIADAYEDMAGYIRAGRTRMLARSTPPADACDTGVVNALPAVSLPSA
jgi:hypothetical protein